MFSVHSYQNFIYLNTLIFIDLVCSLLSVLWLSLTILLNTLIFIGSSLFTPISSLIISILWFLLILSVHSYQYFDYINTLIFIGSCLFTPISTLIISILWFLLILSVHSYQYFNYLNTLIFIGSCLFTPISTLIILGSNQAHSSSSSSSSSLGLSNLPQLLTAAAGAQGQILAVGPQVRSFLLKAKSYLKPCLNYLIDMLLFFF